MGASMRASAAVRQPTDVDRAEPARSTSVDQSLIVLRQVIADLNYSLDALQAAMGKDRSFINKVLNGEKPMPSDFIDALPDDIEAEWHARRAERFGRVVVAPASGDDAVRNLVSGLVGILSPQLPARAGAPLKASLRPSRESFQRAKASLPAKATR